jgi:primosomal protein N' (replication factor Y)
MIIVPRICPACSAEALEPIGSGTERVEEQVQALWPGAAVEVLDRDTARRGEAAAVLERFGRRESQIMVGTQMVSKGHHFPDVVLTAVLLADTYLSFPDFRAVEKTYNLLTQVAGRAGRGERPGRMIIQTFHPQHYAIQAALRHDDRAFAAEEMRFRRIFHYPPYTRMIQLLLRDSNRARGERAIRDLATRIAEHPKSGEFRISGPAPAPFERLRGKWRYQILLRHRSGRRLRETVAEILTSCPSRELVVDVDPHELL